MSDERPRLKHTWQYEGAVRDVAWSPDGTRLAVTTSDGSWVMRLEDDSRSMLDEADGWKVSWSPKGDRIALASNRRRLSVRDAATGEERFGLPEQGEAPSWSPDGELLAMANNDGTVRVWDASSGQEELCLRGHERRVLGVSWSPDGGRIASAYTDQMVRVWDASNGAERLCLRGHGDWVRSVSWTPDGGCIASASDDRTVRVWDASSGQERLCLRGHDRWVMGVSWSPDGRRIASASMDRTVRVWDASSGEECLCLRDHGSGVYGVSWSPDGECIASASSDGTVRLWNVADQGVRVAVRARTPDNLQVYAAVQARTVGRVVELVRSRVDDWVPRLEGAEGKCLSMMSRGSGGAGGVALDHGGRVLYSGHRDGSLRARDLASGEELWCALGHSRGHDIEEIMMSPDGGRIASASGDGTVRVWDASSGAERLCLGGHEGRVWSVSWSPDGERLASVSRDRTVRVWNSSSGEECLRLRGHDSSVMSVSWSPDGGRIASASADQTVRVWDASSGVERLCLRGHERFVWNVSWSPDGQRIASASDEDTVRVWDASSGAERLCLRGHVGEVRCVSWSLDGGRVASASSDRRVRVWDTTTGRLLTTHTTPEDYGWRLAWAASGAFLVSSHGSDVIRIWDTRDTMPTTARPRAAARSLARPLPRDLVVLPAAAASLWRHTQHAVPLSAIHDLLHLTAGRPALSPNAQRFAHHSGMQQLVALRWPTEARAALAVLLLREVHDPAFAPPDGTSPGRLCAALLAALHEGEPREPEPATTTSLVPLEWALSSIDERMLTLLTALGPKACAEDPSLLLSMVSRLPDVIALAKTDRTRLSASLPMTGSGNTQSRGGQVPGGIHDRGRLTDLLPSQWALPRELLRYRHAQGGLLFRARQAEEQPRLRPVVLVLDVSAATLPIEHVLRPAAHALGIALVQAKMPGWLVAAGGDNRVVPLEQTRDVIEVFTAQTLDEVDCSRTLALADKLCGRLEIVGAPAPVIVLLTHPWFGSESRDVSIGRLRGLFVQYPKHQREPVWSSRCERWAVLGPDEGAHACQTLAGLLA
jgi:WD40 repeat protein